MKSGNSIKDMVLESFEDLYKIGTVDEITLREVKGVVRENGPYSTKDCLFPHRFIDLWGGEGP